jgi:hypothetical protein
MTMPRWLVFRPDAESGQRWRVFESRKAARDYRRRFGGCLFHLLETR